MSDTPMPTILIVEDEQQYRDLLEERLKKEKFNIITADNGQTALSSVLQSTPDLILLDLHMPQMDGQTFFYHLCSTMKKDIPVIILTNLTEVTYPAEVKDFIVKANTSLDEIVAKIKMYLPYKTDVIPHA